MGKRTWYLTGVAGAAVFVIGQGVSGTLPKPDADLGEVIQHLLVHRGRILGGAAIASLAAALLLIFASRLKEAMDDAEEGDSPLATPTLLAWVLLFAAIFAGQLLLLAVTWWGSGEGADGLDTMQYVVRLAFDANNLALYSVSAPFAALSILGPCIVAWRTGFLPTWLIGIGAVEVLINVAELMGIGTSHGANAAGYVFGLGPIVWTLWVVCASIVLYRRAAEPTSAG